jgi:hypothetical protein
MCQTILSIIINGLKTFHASETKMPHQFEACGAMGAP